MPLHHLKPALALQFGLSQLTLVIGPALGGLLIGAWGVGAAYVAVGVSCLAMVAALLAMAPEPPIDARATTPIRRSIGEGLRYVRASRRCWAPSPSTS